MTKPKPTTPERPSPGAKGTPTADASLAAKDHYQREKARRARHKHADSDALASAKREYEALLENNAAKGRGGRPKKQPPAPAAADDLEEEGGTGKK
jgi:hypothetical protein